MEVKRIIFDLDNTLIPWKSEYLWAFKQALKDFKLNINPELQGNFIEAYEYTHERYDREAMATYFNEVFHTNINVDFINAWINYLGGMSEKDQKLKQFLQELSKEYELAVLTNWFAITQFNRLKNAGIVQYFKTIHGGEKYMKPSKESFLNATGFYHPEECMMVGDRYEIDLKGAIEVGMQPVLVSINRMPKVETIENIYELKRVLERRN